MDIGGIDYRAVFQSLPSMIALLTPELVYADVNDAYVRQSGRTRQELVGRHVFDVFPDNPDDPGATGVANLAASLRRVLATGERDAMALQRYDVQSTESPGEWQERYWSPVNAPVLDADGRVVLLVHRVEEVTELLRARALPGTDRARALEGELYTRSRELQEVNEGLRAAHAHEREVALTLQEAMLPVLRLTDHHQAAVRYQPAVSSLNVCGDWYDLVDLDDDCLTASVGDVVGHGLTAAAVMGQLRSALSSTSRVAPGPAQALDALDLYARSVRDALSTTVASVHVDWATGLLTYASAGHVPPALARGDEVVFLDRATDPPLGVRPDRLPHPEAEQPFSAKDVLVLYTDGLIERRGEDIDVGLARLARSLTAHRALHPDDLADALLRDVLPPGGPTDDTALVVLRL